jgi:hypothetical protein
VHSCHFYPNTAIHIIHFEIVLAPRFPQLRIFTFKLREVNFGKFARVKHRLIGRVGWGSKIVTRWNALYGIRSRELRSGHRTLGWVMDLSVNTPRSTIPVRCVDVVPIRAGGGESLRRTRGCQPTREDPWRRCVQSLPSLTKKVLNLVSSSLMEVREESTFGFQVVKALSESTAADSNTATRSSRCCATVANSEMRTLRETSWPMKLSFISSRNEWISLRTSFMSSSMNIFVFGSMAP